MASIRTLRIFLSVARHGTFVAAGDEIGLTPAAVGLQIRALEADLNCQLFDRTARAAVLNPHGRRLLPDIEDVVRRYEALAMADASDDLAGTAVMGALVSALMGDFANALWDIKRKHRRLDVRLFAGLSADFTRRVEAGELDAARCHAITPALAGQPDLDAALQRTDGADRTAITAFRAGGLRSRHPAHSAIHPL